VFKIFKITFFILIINFSCSQNDEQTMPSGLFYQSTNFDNIDRDYILYIPSSYEENSSFPIVFNLHGGDMTARQQMENVSDMRSLADTENFILVYPQSTIDDNGVPIWNLGGENSKATDIDDVGYISHLIDEISNFYSTDLDRIYVTGFSNGGYLSFEIACKLSNRIAAFASVAGHMFIDTFNNCSPSHPTPFISINGTEDNYQGIGFYYLSVENSNNYWINFNNNDATPIIINIEDINSADGSTVEYYSWKNGNNGVEVDHYKVIGGGHSYPKINFDSSQENGDIDSDQLIWEFFSRFDINGLR
tara:strand:- start:2067 stop:2981 length:915 start_codon:yes stop_codon:yes gene_type:complete